MEALAYAHSYASYEQEVGIEVHLPAGIWNWRALPSSAWLNLLAIAILVVILSSPESVRAKEARASTDNLRLQPTPPDGTSKQSSGISQSDRQQPAATPQSPVTTQQPILESAPPQPPAAPAPQQPIPEAAPTQQPPAPKQQQPTPEAAPPQPPVPKQQQPIPEAAPPQPPAPKQQQPIPEAAPPQPPAVPTQQQPTPEAVEKPQETPESSQQQPDYFYDGANAAMAAAQLAQTAKTQAEWDTVEKFWQQAIASMQLVPPGDRDYSLAQQKIPEYQSYLNYARQQPRPTPRAAQPQQNATSPRPVPQPQATPPTIEKPPENAESSQQQPDYFYDGVNAAMAAAQLAQTAKTQAEWDTVEKFWQQAIASMQLVPPGDRDYSLAQQKIPEYQSYLNYARQQPRPTPRAAQPQQNATPARPVPQAPATPQTAEKPQETPEPIQQPPDYFYDGTNAAMAAAQLAQKAKTTSEWDAVEKAWQKAIAAMQAVPRGDRDYSLARQKLREYETYLEYARRMPNDFHEAVNAATQAAQLGQQAKTQSQWQTVAQNWQRAIAGMEAVTPDHPQFAIAQQKIVEYKYYLDYVRAKLQSAISPMTLKHAIRGNLSPKSVVYSGRGRFFAQNMMYSHTISVYNQQYELIKTISDAVKLSDYGHKDFPGTYRGAPVEAAFSHGGQYAWISNYQMYGSGFGNPGSDRCSPSAHHDPSFLYRINTDTLNIEKVVKVGSVPKYVATTPDNRFVLVSNWCSWDLSVVDTQQNKEIRRIPLGAYPRGIAIDAYSSKAYVAVMGSSNIAVINLQDFSVGWIRNVGAAPRHLNISPDGRYLYASLNSEGTIAKIDLETSKWTKVRTGNAPRSMVLSADGQFLYVVNYYSNTVSKVRTSDLRVLQNLPTDAHPIGITYDPDTQQVWVACYSGSIMVFQD